ncbi:hypothetical protein PYCCODRAFT_1221826 [Trametes coccinea BRFM310]|uniref:Uncharacterized protein n=1 Tax=Trametes coccinea (strain BRFM310) TaxID=1353009 RepID=A0A1Y2IVW5_TRAC3|nr:hypothetical protein PYCCODRAFT_1221826 [Trametes coccinea BRFM310]
MRSITFSRAPVWALIPTPTGAFSCVMASACCIRKICGNARASVVAECVAEACFALFCLLLFAVHDFVVLFRSCVTSQVLDTPRSCQQSCTAPDIWSPSLSRH